MTLRRGPYLVTRETADTTALLDVVRAALDGGVVIVQYRDKSDDAELRGAQARALRSLCRAFDVPFVVNDDVALAGSVAADGVHVGEHDAGVAAARAALGPGALIGASCYDDLARAERALRDGADYLAFGAFFETSSKATTRRPDPSILGAAAKFGVPRVAIGGITVDNARTLVDAGADQLAVISAVFDAEDPRSAAQALANLYS
jgi:thiamine-phosphate pyrophosphorylase